MNNYTFSSNTEDKILILKIDRAINDDLKTKKEIREILRHTFRLTKKDCESLIRILLSHISPTATKTNSKKFI